MIQNGNNVIIDVWWANEIGIVITQDTYTREYKSYISNVPITLNPDEIKDALHIARWGNKFPLDAAEKLFDIDFNRDWIEDHPEYFV